MGFSIQHFFRDISGLENACMMIASAMLADDKRTASSLVPEALKYATSADKQIGLLNALPNGASALSDTSKGLAAIEVLPRLAILADMLADSKAPQLDTLNATKTFRLAKRVAPKATTKPLMQELLLIETLLRSYGSKKRSSFVSTSTGRQLAAAAGRLSTLLSKVPIEALSSITAAYSLRSATSKLNDDLVTIQGVNKDAGAMIGGASLEKALPFLRDINNLGSLLLSHAMGRDLDRMVKQSGVEAENAYSVEDIFSAPFSFQRAIDAQQQAVQGELSGLSVSQFVASLLSEADAITSKELKAIAGNYISLQLQRCAPSVHTFHARRFIDVLNDVTPHLEALGTSADSVSKLDYLSQSLSNSTTDFQINQKAESLAAAFDNELAGKILSLLTGGSSTHPSANKDIGRAVEYIRERYNEVPVRGPIAQLLSHMDRNKSKDTLEEEMTTALPEVDSKQNVQSTAPAGIEELLSAIESEHQEPILENPPLADVLDAFSFSSDPDEYEVAEVVAPTIQAQHPAQEAREEAPAPSAPDLDSQIDQLPPEILMPTGPAPLSAAELEIKQLRADLEKTSEQLQVANSRLRIRRPLISDMGNAAFSEEVVARLRTLISLYRKLNDGTLHTSIGEVAEAVDLEKDIGDALYKSPRLILSDPVNGLISDANALHDILCSKSSAYMSILENSTIRSQREDGFKVSDMSHNSEFNISPYDLFEGVSSISEGAQTSSSLRGFISAISDKIGDSAHKLIRDTPAYKQSISVKKALLSLSLQSLNKGLHNLSGIQIQSARTLCHAVSKLKSAAPADFEIDGMPLASHLDGIEEVISKAAIATLDTSNTVSIDRAV